MCFLLSLLICFRCHDNLKFPLTYDEKSENLPLFLSHCKYFDKKKKKKKKKKTEMFLELPSTKCIIFVKSFAFDWLPWQSKC